MNEQIASIIASLPHGFAADWCQDFGDEENRYYMDGVDDTDALAEMSQAARAQAMAYWADVQESINEAIEHEQACADALRADDFAAGVEAIRAAAKCEAQWGDDPTYTPVVDAIIDMGHWTIRNHDTGRVESIARDVCTIHPQWVHTQLGTDGTESDLQITMDCYHRDDCIGERDTCGVSYGF